MRKWNRNRFQGDIFVAGSFSVSFCIRFWIWSRNRRWWNSWRALFFFFLGWLKDLTSLELVVWYKEHRAHLAGLLRSLVQFSVWGFSPHLTHREVCNNYECGQKTDKIWYFYEHYYILIYTIFKIFKLILGYRLFIPRTYPHLSTIYALYGNW